jgi:TPR repeat protein
MSDKRGQPGCEQKADVEPLPDESATETEQYGIERDLNDVAQQRLVALALDLGLARAKQASEAADVTALVGEADKEARRAQAGRRYLDEAEQWFRKAASAGHHTAQFNLGVLLARRGNFDEAEEWFLRATSADSAELALRAKKALRDLHSSGSA